MGWTETSRRGLSTKEFLRKEFEYESDRVRLEVLDIKIVKLNTAYMAVRRTNRVSNESFVFGAVVLLAYPRGHFDIRYKAMDEDTGPYAVSCPESILNLLTPTDNENALSWRAKCRQTIADRKARLTLRRGMVFKTTNTVRFKNGKEGTLFIVFGQGGYGMVLGVSDDGVPNTTADSYRFTPRTFGPLTKVEPLDIPNHL